MGELTKDEELKVGQDTKSANLRKRGGMGGQFFFLLWMKLSPPSLLNGLDQADNRGCSPDYI